MDWQNGTTMKIISFKLPEDVYAKLGALASEKKTTRSRLMRDALVEYLGRGGRRASGSVAELASDLVGSLSGPSDLSTNPKHLDDLGR